MKKIGVIDGIKHSGPGTINIIYKDPKADGHIYISHLSISIVDAQGIIMKRVKPKYNRNNFYTLGEIVEYDEDTNSIKPIDFSRTLTKSEIKQVIHIYLRYQRVANKDYNYDLILQEMLECATDEEKLEVLKRKSKISLDEEIDAQLIKEGILRQLQIRDILKLNKPIEQRRVVK